MSGINALETWLVVFLALSYVALALALALGVVALLTSLAVDIMRERSPRAQLHRFSEGELYALCMHRSLFYLRHLSGCTRTISQCIHFKANRRDWLNLHSSFRETCIAIFSEMDMASVPLWVVLGCISKHVGLDQSVWYFSIIFFVNNFIRWTARLICNAN